MKINHAILHVFDFVACINTYADEELDLSDKTAKRYVTSLAKKTLGELDSMHGQFSENSVFAGELARYFRGERGFVELSRQIAEYFAGELGHMEKAESTDLLVVDFDGDLESNVSEMDAEEAEAAFRGRGRRCFALVLLESKPAYLHTTGGGQTGTATGITRHRSILPNPSQKMTSYACIDAATLDVSFVDKERTIAGENMLLIPDGLLQCSKEASVRETFSAVTELVEQVAEEYGTNTAVALSRAKAYAAANAEDSDELYLEDMGREVFGDNPAMRRRFEEAATARELPDRVALGTEAAARVARNHKIRTDTGIEITFPAEYSRNPDYIDFVAESDGTYSIQLKNIGHIENR